MQANKTLLSNFYAYMLSPYLYDAPTWSNHASHQGTIVKLLCIRALTTSILTYVFSSTSICDLASSVTHHASSMLSLSLGSDR